MPSPTRSRGSTAPESARDWRTRLLVRLRFFHIQPRVYSRLRRTNESARDSYGRDQLDRGECSGGNDEGVMRNVERWCRLFLGNYLSGNSARMRRSYTRVFHIEREDERSMSVHR